MASTRGAASRSEPPQDDEDATDTAADRTNAGGARGDSRSQPVELTPEEACVEAKVLLAELQRKSTANMNRQQLKQHVEMLELRAQAVSLKRQTAESTLTAANRRSPVGIWSCA